jgi:integrase
MPRITSKGYRQFLDTGIIDLITKEQFAKMLENVKHKQLTQARALFIILYYSGRRPSEILELTPKLVTKEKNYIQIHFPTGKSGRATLNYYPIKNPHILEFWNYAKAAGFPDFKMFFSFRNKAIGGTKKQIVTYTIKTGEKRIKEYGENSHRLYYWLTKWSKITPYFFRHNRFSSMAEQGATIQDIKHAKGSKTLASVEPYIHLSKFTARKLSRFYK